MTEAGLQPNLITYSTMIKGFCLTGDMSSAFAIFKELQKGSEQPDEVVCAAILESIERKMMRNALKMTGNGEPEVQHAAGWLLKGGHGG